MYKKGDNFCVEHKGCPWAVKVIEVDARLRRIKVHYMTLTIGTMSGLILIVIDLWWRVRRGKLDQFKKWKII